MVTEPGTRSEVLLLVSDTVRVLVAGAFKFTVQALLCAPVRDRVPHEMLLKVTAAADPEEPCSELLDRYVNPPHPERAMDTQAASAASR